MVAILRISDKRTLAKMNAFDLVVTVALDSTVSSILLSKEVPLLEGVLGLALLASSSSLPGRQSSGVPRGGRQI